MNQERLMEVLLGPVVSEKSATLADANRQFTFRVTMDATKREIGQAVEKLFEVEIDSVRVVNIKGKRKRIGAKQGKRKDSRKAYVRLKEGHDIDFAGGA
ncbi:MAG: 50S ribosomal protein L23 [bacterium]|nr:50S ribosomal protein L23 [bacterium]